MYFHNCSIEPVDCSTKILMGAGVKKNYLRSINLVIFKNRKVAQIFSQYGNYKVINVTNPKASTNLGDRQASTKSHDTHMLFHRHYETELKLQK